MSIHQYDTTAHEGFLLAEEAALKLHFSGIEVPDKRSTKEVPVYFRWPESERAIRYPMITLDLLSITPAYDRWHSSINEFDTPALFETRDENGSLISSREGHYYPSVTYDATPNDDESGYYIGNYLPFNLMYQVSTWTRSIQQDRILTGKFFTDMVGPRSFFIGVDADHTWRRCELLEWISGDTLETTEASKRTFRKIYTINMEAEIPTSQIYELVRVGRVHVSIFDKLFDPERVLLDEFTEPAP